MSGRASKTNPEWLRGVFPALVTPFTDEGDVDERALRALIRRLLPDVDGVVPVGTTGEFVQLTEAEKRRVIDVTVEEVGGRVPVLAGTGCASTSDTVALTRYAKRAGATAALVVSPFYFRPAFNEVYEHFEAVDRVGLPIVAYNIPQCAGTHFRWWTAEGLAYLQNVVGIKDSSGDVAFLMALFEKVQGKIAVLCGHDEIVLAALAAGGDGAILASANLIPDIWQEIYQAVKRGDLTAARARQAQVQKLARIVTRKGPCQAAKEGLRMQGFPVGDSRHPIMPGGVFEREDREELRIQLETLGKAPLPRERPAAERDEDLVLRAGEGLAGPPSFELAHIDLLIGLRQGPVGRALTRALDEARPSHELHIACERPTTLLVPTITIRDERQAAQVYEDALRGVATAVRASIEDGTLPGARLDDLALIANVFVHPAAANRTRIELNNYKAMRAAIRKAMEERPSLDELVAEKHAARHPLRYAP
ncbi:MAG: formaldehyde-activating enzyme [Myxococcales bacterium]|jgi:4-hydroxy-tetrahydrodipicolinate synthase